MNVGDHVSVHFSEREARMGWVVHLLPANIKPPDSIIKKYYQIEPGNPEWIKVARAVSVVRVVVETDPDHYVIAPAQVVYHIN